MADVPFDGCLEMELCNELDDDCDDNVDEGIDTDSDPNNCAQFLCICSFISHSSWIARSP